MPVFYTTAGESTELNEIILLNTNTLTFLAIQSPFSRSHGESPEFNLPFSMFVWTFKSQPCCVQNLTVFLSVFFSHS